MLGRSFCSLGCSRQQAQYLRVQVADDASGLLCKLFDCSGVLHRQRVVQRGPYGNATCIDNHNTLDAFVVLQTLDRLLDFRLPSFMRETGESVLPSCRDLKMRRPDEMGCQDSCLKEKCFYVTNNCEEKVTK